MNKVMKLIYSLFVGVFIFCMIFTTVQNAIAIQDIQVNLRYYNNALYLLTDYLRTMKADNIDNLQRDVNITEALKDLTIGLCDIEKKVGELDSTTINIKKDVIDMNSINKSVKKEIINNKKSSIKAIGVIGNYILNYPQIESTKKQMKELKLLQINVMICNATEGYSGSGSTIKYKDKYYILSVAHLVKYEKKDKMELWENGVKVCDLKIVKIDVANDLCLFAPINEYIIPHFYTELAETEAIPSEELYIVGNPLGIEDLLSDGRVINYEKTLFYYIGTTYFGSSGGGVYNKEGQIVGVIDVLVASTPTKDLCISRNPMFVINGAVRLSVVKKFMEDII